MANEKRNVEQFPAKATPGATDQLPFWDFGIKKMVRMTFANLVQFLSNTFSAIGHLHDDRYYTKSQTETLVANIGESFKGAWVAGAKSANTMWAYNGVIWFTKRPLTENTVPPTVEDADWGIAVIGLEGDTGAEGKSAAIGYADDAAGTGYSSSPAGKKFIAFKAAAPSDTVNAAFFAGLWQPWNSTIKALGVQSGTTLDFANDYNVRVSSGEDVVINTFLNVALGRETILKWRSLNTRRSADLSGTFQINQNSPYITGTGNVASELVPGDLVEIQGATYGNSIVRILSSVGSTIVMDRTFGTVTTSGLKFKKVIRDTLTLPTATASINGQANQVLTTTKVFEFLDGYLNEITISCEKVTGGYEFRYAFNHFA